MSTFFKLFALAFPTFLIIDLVWLGVLARPFYQAQMGPLMRESPNWAAALVFYVIFVAGIVILAVLPAVERKSFVYALTMGGVLGLVSYAAYDLTNLATLRDFPRTMAMVDLVWGTILTGGVSGITFKLWFLLS